MLLQSNSALDSLNISLEKALKTRDETIANLKNSLKDAEKNIRDKNSEENINDEIITKYNIATEKCTALSGELDKLKADYRELGEKSAARIETLEKNLKTSEERVQQLVSQQQKIKQGENDGIARIASLETQLLASQAGLKHAAEQIAELQSHNLEHRKRNAELAATVQDLELQLGTSGSNSSTTAAGLPGSLRLPVGRSASLVVGGSGSLRDEMLGAAAGKEELEKLVRQLTRKLAEAESMRSEPDAAVVAAKVEEEVRVRMNKEKEKRKKTEKERDDALHRIVQLEADLQVVTKATDSSLGATKTQVVTLESKIASLTSSLATKNDELAQMQRKLGRQDSAHAQELKELNAKLESTFTLSESRKEQILTLEKRLEEFLVSQHRAFEETESRLSNVVGSYDKLSEEHRYLDNLRAQCVRQEESLVDLRAKLEAAQSKCSSWEQEVQRLTRELDESRARLAQQQLTAEESHASTMESLESRIRELEEQLAQSLRMRDEMISAHKREIQDLAIAHDKQSIITEYENMIASITEDNNSLKQKYRDMSHTVESLEGKIKDFEALQKQLENISSELAEKSRLLEEARKQQKSAATVVGRDAKEKPSPPLFDEDEDGSASTVPTAQSSRLDANTSGSSGSASVSTLSASTQLLFPGSSAAAAAAQDQQNSASKSPAMSGAHRSPSSHVHSQPAKRSGSGLQQRRGDLDLAIGMGGGNGSWLDGSILTDASNSPLRRMGGSLEGDFFFSDLTTIDENILFTEQQIRNLESKLNAEQGLLLSPDGSVRLENDLDEDALSQDDAGDSDDGSAENDHDVGDDDDDDDDGDDNRKSRAARARRQQQQQRQRQQHQQQQQKQQKQHRGRNSNLRSGSSEELESLREKLTQLKLTRDNIFMHSAKPVDLARKQLLWPEAARLNKVSLASFLRDREASKPFYLPVGNMAHPSLSKEIAKQQQQLHQQFQHQQQQQQQSVGGGSGKPQANVLPPEGTVQADYDDFVQLFISSFYFFHVDYLTAYSEMMNKVGAELGMKDDLFLIRNFIFSRVIVENLDLVTLEWFYRRNIIGYVTGLVSLQPAHRKYRWTELSALSVVDALASEIANSHINSPKPASTPQMFGMGANAIPLMKTVSNSSGVSRAFATNTATNTAAPLASPNVLATGSSSSLSSLGGGNAAGLGQPPRAPATTNAGDGRLSRSQSQVTGTGGVGVGGLRGPRVSGGDLPRSSSGIGISSQLQFSPSLGGNVPSVHSSTSSSPLMRSELLPPASDPLSATPQLSGLAGPMLAERELEVEHDFYFALLDIASKILSIEVNRLKAIAEAKECSHSASMIEFCRILKRYVAVRVELIEVQSLDVDNYSLRNLAKPAGGKAGSGGAAGAGGAGGRAGSSSIVPGSLSSGFQNLEKKMMEKFKELKESSPSGFFSNLLGRFGPSETLADKNRKSKAFQEATARQLKSRRDSEASGLSSSSSYSSSLSSTTSYSSDDDDDDDEEYRTGPKGGNGPRRSVKAGKSGKSSKHSKHGSKKQYSSFIVGKKKAGAVSDPAGQDASDQPGSASKAAAASGSEGEEDEAEEEEEEEEENDEEYEDSDDRERIQHKKEARNAISRALNF